MMLALVLLLPLAQAQLRVDPLVEIPNGLIRGLRSDDGLYSMFLGIPYGVVDPGNPFGPSSPHPGFDTTFEAYSDSSICPQMSSNGVSGTLNCLNLNIYVPSSATSRNRLPVMLWIHGGDFVKGSGGRDLYSPEFLIRDDVIFVSINYRLGPYGFLCPDAESVAGNQGLKDQLLALRWIRQNIPAFGGDITKVTVFGIDSGAESINLHLVSPHERLFDRAIVQSASELNVNGPNNAVPIAIAERLGYETENVDDALSFISGQDYNLVIAAFDDLGLQVGPCLENDYDGVEKFIDQEQNSAKIRNTPIIIGYTDNEMLYEYANANPDVFINFSFENRLNIDSIDQELVDFIKHFYIGDEDLNENVRHEIMNFASDVAYYHPTERLINKYTAEGATVFYYMFSYNGDRNYMKLTENITEWGATHLDELGYLFSSSVRGQPNLEDAVVIDNIASLWTNFAKHGDPTPEESDLSVKWTPVSSTNRWFLEIHSDLYVHSRPYYHRMAFWDLFYKVQEASKK